MKKLSEKKQEVINEEVNRLKPEVTREEFLEVLGENWMSTFKVRCYICPELAKTE